MTIWKASPRSKVCEKLQKLIDFLSESWESKMILQKNNKVMTIESINKELVKCMLSIESIIKVHTIDIEQN